MVTECHQLLPGEVERQSGVVLVRADRQLEAGDGAKNLLIFRLPSTGEVVRPEGRVLAEVHQISPIVVIVVIAVEEDLEGAVAVVVSS